MNCRVYSVEEKNNGESGKLLEFFSLWVWSLTAWQPRKCGSACIRLSTTLSTGPEALNCPSFVSGFCPDFVEVLCHLSWVRGHTWWTPEKAPWRWDRMVFCLPRIRRLGSQLWRRTFPFSLFRFLPGCCPRCRKAKNSWLVPRLFDSVDWWMSRGTSGLDHSEAPLRCTPCSPTTRLPPLALERSTDQLSCFCGEAALWGQTTSEWGRVLWSQHDGVSAHPLQAVLRQCRLPGKISNCYDL